MNERIISSADIANVMISRALRFPEIISELEKRLKFRCDHAQRQIVRNTIHNMRRSSNVELDVAQEQEDGTAVSRWHLKKIKPSYFRKSSATRRIKSAGGEVTEQRKTTKKEMPRRRIPTDCDVFETNFCRLARAVDIAWRTGVWTPPELLTVKKYRRRKREE
jgi:hypothetical protein